MSTPFLRQQARDAGMSWATFQRQHAAQKSRPQVAPVPSPPPSAHGLDIPALTAAIAAGVAQALGQTAAPANDPLPAAQPFGQNGPILHPLFGVHTRRAAPVLDLPSDELVMDLVKGDGHGDPSPDIERHTLRCAALIGHHAAAKNPRHFIDIGDFMDWRSVCHHVKNHTWKSRAKPTIEQDLASVDRHIAALTGPMDAAGVCVGKRVMCLGNHEAWLSQYEDEHIEVHGAFTGRFRASLARAGFSVYDYGEYVFVGGIGYVHAPQNVMGRPVGGQTAENTVSMQSTHDTVFGHTHVYGMARRRKMGFRNIVTTLNAGSSMPEGYVGEHAQLTQGSWIDSGVLEVYRRCGRIVSHRHVPMSELEELYGHLI